MKIVNISNWSNQDMHSVRGYESSYSVKEEEVELFNIDLLKQMGFYQISEFTSPIGEGAFIIEQTNRVGTPKIAAFDKETGLMLGAFKTNSFLNTSEELAFQICTVKDLNNTSLIEKFGCNIEDFVAISTTNKTPIAVFIRLPKKQRSFGLLSKLKSMAHQLTHGTQDVMQLIILDNSICDDRMLYAISVVLHNRGGLQLN